MARRNLLHLTLLAGAATSCSDQSAPVTTASEKTTEFALTGTLPFSPNVSMFRYARLSDGGVDISAVGIFLGNIAVPPHDPCLLTDAGKVLESASILVKNRTGAIDGGTYTFYLANKLPDAGAIALMVIALDGGLRYPAGVASAGTLTLTSQTSSMSGSFSAKLVGGSGLDSGTVAGKFVAKECF